MAPPAVVFEHVTRCFGDVVAVSDVTLTIESGEILGLLGPNGAGKSTLTSIATGLLAPDEGTVTILGRDIRREREEAKRLIGVVPQDILVYDYLTPIENIQFFGVMNGVTGGRLRRRISELIDFVGLDEHALNQQVCYLSGGMRRRVNIACGIVHNPEVVFLDEPTVGLDPNSRLSLWTLIRQLNDAGKTVILTTHLMDEAEELCDRVAIMDRGRVVALDTPERLMDRMETREAIEVVVQDLSEEYAAAVKRLDGVRKVTLETSEAESTLTYRILVEHAETALPDIVSAAREVGVRIREVRVTTPSLADVFLEFTGRTLAEAELEGAAGAE
ncbi:MAG: ATP-binding cassette domain-containing protein [Candidatus Thorarchaeota archaeon]